MAPKPPMSQAANVRKRPGETVALLDTARVVVVPSGTGALTARSAARRLQP